MTTEPLFTISSFAHRVGVPATALRYYAAEGVLPPAEVDGRTGYRYYTASQERTAILLRRLRDAGVSLDDARAVLAAPPDQAIQLVTALRSGLETRLDDQRRGLDDVLAQLHSGAGERREARLRVSGPGLARAVEQVATAAELGGSSEVLWQVDQGELLLGATDRYWLVRHVVTPLTSAGYDVRAVVRLDQCPALAAAARTALEIDVVISTDGVMIDSEPVAAAVADLLCDLRAFDPTPRTTTLVVDRGALIDRLGRSERLVIKVDEGHQVVIHDRPAALALAAVGAPCQVELLNRLVRPLAAAAVGPELMIMIGTADEPVLLRSPDQPGFVGWLKPWRRTA